MGMGRGWVGSGGLAPTSGLKLDPGGCGIALDGEQEPGGWGRAGAGVGRAGLRARARGCPRGGEGSRVGGAGLARPVGPHSARAKGKRENANCKGRNAKAAALCQMQNAKWKKKIKMHRTDPPPNDEVGQTARAWPRPRVPRVPTPAGGRRRQPRGAQGGPGGGGAVTPAVPPSPRGGRGLASPSRGGRAGLSGQPRLYRLLKHFPYESSETFLILS